MNQVTALLKLVSNQSGVIYNKLPLAVYILNLRKVRDESRYNSSKIVSYLTGITYIGFQSFIYRLNLRKVVTG